MNIHKYLHVDGDECYTEPSAPDYRGFVNTTRGGLSCQVWTSQSPHQHSRTPDRYPDSGLGDHNYCRNPDQEDMVWCYTMDTDVRWDFCSIGLPQQSCEDGLPQTTDSTPSTTSYGGKTSWFPKVSRFKVNMMFQIIC